MTSIAKHLFPLLFSILPIVQANSQQADPQARTVHIQVIPGLQYDLVRFQVKPGEKVKLVFSNDDDMGHNLLITTPGSREEVVNAALQLAEKGPQMDYTPPLPEVLWSIPVIYAGESRALEFEAPEEPGAYPYVCTYPGHGFLMYGVMYVSESGKMPDLAEDPHIPPIRREADMSHENLADHATHLEEKPPLLHPYETIPPYYYRVFIEGSGLASIAVHLPGKLSYSWDAEACQLRFAWEGEFLDNEDLWHGHKNAYAHVLGEVFYRDKTSFPLRIGEFEAIPEAEYLGYRLIDRYPEFHYRLSGADVFEIIHPKPDGTGLIRTIRIEGNQQPAWFVHEPDDGMDYEASAGTWEGHRLRLTPNQAREFTLIMTKNPN